MPDKQEQGPSDKDKAWIASDEGRHSYAESRRMEVESRQNQLRTALYDYVDRMKAQGKDVTDLNWTDNDPGLIRAVADARFVDPSDSAAATEFIEDTWKQVVG